MNIIKSTYTILVIAVTLLLIDINLQGQDISKSSMLDYAKKLTPLLHHQILYPENIVGLAKDEYVWLGWKTFTVENAAELSTYKLQKGDTLILDFGRNIVGYLQGVSSGRAKVQIEPAEVLAELGDSWEKFPASFDNGYKPIRTWSPKVLDIQTDWRSNERLTFRYVRLVILEAANEIVLSKLNCDEVSAVHYQSIKPLEGFSAPMQQIDLVAQYTLRNCIQEVFEDGPKRDQRLWLGDLRLEALPDGLLFKSDTLVKRCILLFAGSQREDGFIPACVFTPTGREPEIGDEMIPDYAMLFGSVLLGYSTNTNDWALAKRLYPLACQQVELVCNKWLNSKNILEIPDNVWQFIDWSKNLDRQAAEQATAIYSIKSLLKLAQKLGVNEDISKWDDLSNKMQQSAMKYLYDKEKGLFISGQQKQVSYASQIWMILAGVVDKNTGVQILNHVKADSTAIKPGTPYLMHHLVQAYLLCDMDEEAYQLIETYWGGMIDKGADTFWEIYDPNNPFKSPYNSHLFNSYCHAWSCTPAWFLRHPVYGKRLQIINRKKTHFGTD